MVVLDMIDRADKCSEHYRMSIKWFVTVDISGDMSLQFELWRRNILIR